MSTMTEGPKFGISRTPHQRAIDALLQKEKQNTDHVKVRTKFGRYIVADGVMQNAWFTRAEALRLLRDLPNAIKQLPPTT